MAYVRRNGAAKTIITFDAATTAATLRILKQADANLYKELRATMRKEASKIKNAQAAAVRGLATSGSRGGGGAARVLNVTGGAAQSAAANRRGERARGLRNAAAGALKIEYREKATARRPFLGIRIRMSATAMPGDQRRLPKHMNYGRWRHPVFGNEDAWVTQTISPDGWFDGTFAKMRGAAAVAIGTAIDDAFRKAGLLK